MYVGNEQPPYLVFNKTALSITDNHAHLSVTFSQTCKWHTHINNIVLSASKLIEVMRKLKFTVRRKTLNQIYVSFLTPTLENAVVVCDNCTQQDKDRLEKNQIEAARLVTGTTIYITLQKLYREIG